MKIARVIGTVVSTIKHSTHEGQKILLVQAQTVTGQPWEPSFLAIDGAQAGVGDRVLVLEEGNGCRQVMQCNNAPCEAVVVGIIDRVDVVESPRE